MEVEHPVRRRYTPAFHLHATLASMLSPTLIGDQVLEVRQPYQKCPLAPRGVVKPLHGAEFPLQSVMRLIQHRAGHRHLGVCQHRIPARLLGLQPASHALAIGWSSGGGDVVHTVAEPLPQRKYAQALALPRSILQGVELRAQRLAHRGREGHQFLRELEERVA